MAEEDDLVLAALRRMIEGAVAPGARLAERWFVDTFGVTHTQAREALHQLDKLGALTLSSRRGATLARPQDADPTDIRPIWQALLALAIDRAKIRRGDITIAPVDAAPGAWRDYLKLRTALALIGEASGLPRLAAILQRLGVMSMIAHGRASPIDVEALSDLAEHIAQDRFDDADRLIAASFIETTRRSPARREAAQLPGAATPVVIDKGRTARKVRHYVSRIGQRLLATSPSAPSATDQVAAAILQRIQFGALKPGDPIRELPLAAEFGTSRGPVREAFRLLDRHGLISMEGRRGVFVRRLDESDVADLFAIRAVLSGVQMAEAAQAPDRPAWIDDELVAGADLLDALSHDGDSPFENYIVARRTLALVTLAAGGNIMIGRLAAELEGEVAILWAGVVTPQRRLTSARAWRSIVDAILAGDATEARALGRQVVEEAGAEALKTIQRAPR